MLSDQEREYLYDMLPREAYGFKGFANHFGGEIVEIRYCSDGRGILPSCEGHAFIRVPKEKREEAMFFASLLSQHWDNFSSISIVE